MSTNPNPDFNSDIPNSERDANALDRALDEFVRGKRKQVRGLDQNLSSTIDRIFVLAEVSGMTGAVQVPQPRRLLPWKVGIPVKQVVSITSTIAAVVILAIGINATVPGFRDQNAGLGTAVPTSDADFAPLILVEALAPGDCNVEPRSREELHEILSVVPSDQDLPWVGESDDQVDQATVDLLNQNLRTWQACARFNNTFATMVLETSGFIRRQVYADLYTVNPYSDATIDEILDGFLSTDMVYGARTPVPGDQPNTWYVLVVDESRPVNISENGDVIELFVNMVSPIVESTDDQRDSQPGDFGDGGFVRFDLEDGVWRIALTERDLLSGIRYPSESFVKD